MPFRRAVNTLENRVEQGHKRIENDFDDSVMMNRPRSRGGHIWGVKACQGGGE